MKNICFLTLVHPIFDRRIFCKEAKTLAGADYNVTLIVQHNRRQIIDRIKIVPLPKSNNRFSRMLITTWRVFYLALKQKADLYHLHDPELIPIGLFLKIFTKAKVIYDVHEDVPKSIFSKTWIPKRIRKTLSILFNLFEKQVSQKFDYIIAATPSIEKNFYKSKTITIRNFPIIEKFALRACPSRNRSRRQYFSVIYIGNISKSNGIIPTIQALKYINSNFKVRIQLLGRFSSLAYKSKLLQLKAWQQVDCHGWILPERISFYLAQADAGVICAPPEPNSLEAEPNKLFEYMLASLPVITSDFPLWKKIVAKNNCGICVNPLQPKKIAQAIEYLIEHPGEARKMGRNGKRLILEKYNWKKESKKLLNVYKKLFKG